MKKIETIAEVGLFAPDGFPVGVVTWVEFEQAINVQEGENVRLIRDPETGGVIGAEKYKEGEDDHESSAAP